MAKKKTKKVAPPQYFLSATNQRLLNYQHYHFSTLEKILYFVLLFAVGASIGLLFYGGIGKDSYGEATTTTTIANTTIATLFGLVAVRLFLPVIREQLQKKRQDVLYKQFVDLLDSLSTSIASGNNVPTSFIHAKTDLLVQYAEDAYILQEIKEIVAGLENNIPIEAMLVDLGKRSGLPDIENFGKIFEVAYPKGGNIKDIVRNTHEIISTKMQIQMEIKTKMASNKNEQNIMAFMPILLIGMIKMMGSDFAQNFTSPTGLISTTIALGMFVSSYFVGRAVMKIDV